MKSSTTANGSTRASNTESNQVDPSATDERPETPDAQEDRFAGAVDFEQVWRELPSDERLADILTRGDDPQQWFEPDYLDTFAAFYHNKPIWGSVKARAAVIRINQHDLEEAVKTIVRLNARKKLAAAIADEDPSITPEAVVATFTADMWVEDTTITYLVRFYDDAPTWMRMKMAAKGAGISPYDLDKAVKHKITVAAKAAQKPRGAPAHPAPPAGGTTRPIIDVTVNMFDVCDKAQDAINAVPDGPHVFQRKRQLVHISATPPKLKWLRRAPDMPGIAIATTAYVRALASTAAEWRKLDKRTNAQEPTLPPTWLAETIRDLPGVRFPQLEGVAYAPTLVPDGTIIAEAGYNEDTGLFVCLDTTYPAVKANPTGADVRRALKFLKAPFKDFRFDENTKASSLSAVLASILTVLCRYAIAGDVPLFAITATMPRSGKGLLVDVISLIATGRYAPRWVQPKDRDGDEERKRMVAIGMSGDPLVLLDNIARPLGSEALDAALTCKGTFADRVLGKNTERIEVPMHVVFFATGNNIVFKADTAPRCVPIALDPREERPDQRTDFVHKDLLTWVKKRRPVLVHAALTLMRAFCLTPEKDRPTIPAMGGFEEWNALIRRALMWAEEPDPLAGQNTLALENDTGSEQLANLLTAWAACYKDRAVTLREAKGDIEIGAKRQGPPNEWNDLGPALCSFDERAKDGTFNEKTVGTGVAKFHGRVLNGQRWERYGERTKYGYRWRVVDLKTATTAPPSQTTKGVSGVSNYYRRAKSVKSENVEYTDAQGENDALDTPDTPNTPPAGLPEAFESALCSAGGRHSIFRVDVGFRCIRCFAQARQHPGCEVVGVAHSTAIRDAEGRKKEKYRTNCDAVIETWEG